jgi:hypothetical protein
VVACKIRTRSRPMQAAGPANICAGRPRWGVVRKAVASVATSTTIVATGLHSPAISPSGSPPFPRALSPLFDSAIPAVKPPARLTCRAALPWLVSCPDRTRLESTRPANRNETANPRDTEAIARRHPGITEAPRGQPAPASRRHHHANHD